LARVLIIIDDKSFALTLCEMLEVSGHEIIESARLH
jgi:CheY-like chemotaxis protein